MLCLYRRRLNVTGIFLDYASKFLASKPINFLYIVLFLILTVGLIVLCLFQYLALSSHGEPIQEEGDIYLHSQGSSVLTILVIM